MTAGEFVERSRADEQYERAERATKEARHWEDQLRFSEDARARLVERLNAMQSRCAAVEADNARLRALVKTAERNGPSGVNCNQCPWCPADTTRDDRRHYDYCQAFTPEGEVK